MQLVKHAIERVFGELVEVGPEKVGARGAADPGGHGMLGARRDQAVEGHGTGEPLHRFGQL